jgi:hypothetical protein
MMGADLPRTRYVVDTDPFNVERLAWKIQVADRPREVAMSALAAFEVAC